MKLGRLGVWYSTDKLNGEQLAEFAQAVEKNGYAALWYPESRGYETVALASYLLSKSEKLVIGSSIANIYARDAFTARRAMVSLNELHDNRFILGLGVSHIPMVEGLRGHKDDKPVTTMRIYLEQLHKDLPTGQWFDYAHGASLNGGTTISYPVDSKTWEDIPLFVRAGSIIPMGINIQNTTTAQSLKEIRVYPGKAVEFTLYDDDGVSYDYEKGKGRTTHLRWDDKEGQLTAEGDPL